MDVRVVDFALRGGDEGEERGEGGGGGRCVGLGGLRGGGRIRGRVFGQGGGEE